MCGCVFCVCAMNRILFCTQFWTNGTNGKNWITLSMDALHSSSSYLLGAIFFFWFLCLCIVLVGWLVRHPNCHIFFYSQRNIETLSSSRSIMSPRYIHIINDDDDDVLQPPPKPNVPIWYDYTHTHTHSNDDNLFCLSLSVTDSLAVY